ncbi:unnamed protein product [Paramecium octaurelia]|uniref:Actin-related protein 2 n=1 Tax=Paramecium octaurelia TaxID=43137 RepID=A0A8S1TD26_PAROT|nr:unnamed protein product [Paramecium octaurelia]
MSIPIIEDSGTGYLKIGFAGDNFPAHSFPAMVGRPTLRADEQLDDANLKDIMIGDEAQPYRGLLELTHPLEEGVVKNWDDMELIWNYGYKKLGIDPKDQTVLMTEAAGNPKKNREKMAEIKFEKFGFAQLNVGIQALLPLFAEGLRTALLLDAGDGVTHCMPVYDGFCLNQGAQRMNIAGRHVTDQLVKLLFQRGYAFNSSADFELVREIKEALCFVSSDIRMDTKLAQETTCHESTFRLPDGGKVKIGQERYMAPEILFSPWLLGKDAPGCADIVFNAIQKSPIDSRKTFYENILISGGTTMFPGFPTRLQNQLRSIFEETVLKGNTAYAASSKIKIKVLDPARRKYNVFIGASFLSNVMKDKTNFWISKKDWQELGPERAMMKVMESLL